MKLTPLDIRKHEFARSLRGYDPEEVKAFTDMVSRQWEEVLDELRHARDRVRELEGKIAHYEKVESALHEALESARSGARRTQEQAEERARLIVEEAELKAEQRLQEVDQRQGNLRHEVAGLQRRHDEIVARLRHFLMSELEILARHEEDRPIGFMQLMPSQPAESLPTPPKSPRTPAAREEPAVRETEEPAEADEPSEPVAEAGEERAQGATTYGDFYARAAAAEREAEQADAAESDELEDVEDEDEEPTWTLRSIMGGQEDEDEPTAEEAEQATAPDAERERIRRILEDLD
jgi:cell division initiation protein